MAKTQTTEDVKLYNASLEILRLRSKLSDLFYNFAHTNNSNNLETKISLLKTIEQTEYKPLLKNLVYKKSPSELLLLSGILDDLGTITHEIGKLTQILEATPKEAEISPEVSSHRDSSSRTTNVAKPTTTHTSLKYYTDAAILHQYVISILSEDETTDYNKISIEEQYKKLDEIKVNVFSSISGTSNTESTTKIISTKSAKEESTIHRQYLKDLREKSKCRVEEIEKYRLEARDDLYITTSRSLFEDIAKRMKSFLSTLYQESEQEFNQLLQIPEPPCTYSVTGLGSLALNQATPYSDLEFAILLKHDGKTKEEGDKIKEYFRNLTHLVHCKVINLGETIIPTSKYGLDLSHLVHRGVNFDLGGKTPLGRIDKDKPYELIKTVEQMMRYVRNEESLYGEKPEHLDKSLPFILENVAHIYGSGDKHQKLLEDYKIAVTNFLHEKLPKVEVRAEVLKTTNITISTTTAEVKAVVDKIDGPQEAQSKELPKTKEDKFTQTAVAYEELPKSTTLQHELRAIKVLEEGAVELDYLNRPLALPQANLKEINYQGDIFKLQPHLSDFEGRLFNVKQEIYRLPDRMIYNLGMLYGIQGESNCDIVDKLQAQGIINEEAAINIKYAITFATTLRLKTYLHNKSQTENLSLFAGSNFTEDTSKQIETVFHLTTADLKEDGGLFRYFYTALELHKKLEEFCDVQNIETPTSSQDQQDFFKSCNFYLADNANKGFIHDRLMHFQQAISSLEEAEKECSRDNTLQLLNIKHTLGLRYMDFGKTDKAIEQWNYLLEIEDDAYKNQEHLNIPAVLNHLGCTYRAKGEYDKAIELNTKSLDMTRIIYKDQPYLGIAVALNNLGLVYYAKEELNKAIDYLIKSLDMTRIIYKDQPCLNIATSLNNLGTAYEQNGQYGRAIECYEESYDILQYIYKGEPHPAIAGFWINMGNIHSRMQRYEKAIECHKKSLDIQELIYKDKPHPDITKSLNALCVTYNCNGNYDEALEYNQQNIDMLRSIYPNSSHPDIAASLCNRGSIYSNIGRHDWAIECCNNSIEMIEETCKTKQHPTIAQSLGILGNTHMNMGKYDKAILYYKDSIEMLKNMNCRLHPDTAMSWYHLGNLHLKQKNYCEAKKCYEESLEIEKLIYKDQLHPGTAKTLGNLGLTYYEEGWYDKAIKYYIQSLERQKLLYHKQLHPDVSVSLNNLGIAHKSKGDLDKAIGYSSQALQIILHFPNHFYKKSIISGFIEIVEAFSHYYSFNAEKIHSKIMSCIQRDYNFTDWTQHLAATNSIPNTKSQKQDKLEELTLAWVFFPQEYKQAILAQLNSSMFQERQDMVTSSAPAVASVEHLGQGADVDGT